MRKINHCSEPKSNKQAQKNIVQKAADTEPGWCIGKRVAPPHPRLSPAPALVPPLPARHRAGSASNTRAARCCGLSTPAELWRCCHVFNIYYLQYNINLDHPQGGCGLSPGQTPHSVGLSRSSRVATSCAARVQTSTDVRYRAGEAGLVQKQLSRFLKANGN